MEEAAIASRLQELKAAHTTATAVLANLAAETLHRPGHDASQADKDNYQRKVEEYTAQGKEVQRIKQFYTSLAEASELPTASSSGNSTDKLYKPPTLTAALVLKGHSTAIMEPFGFAWQ